MGEDQLYQQKARELVVNYVNERLEKTDRFRLELEDVYVVWFCYILGNWKALISTNIPDGMYYEVTHNHTANETYLDAYKKFENIKVIDTDI